MLLEAKLQEKIDQNIMADSSRNGHSFLFSHQSPIVFLDLSPCGRICNPLTHPSDI